MQHFQLMQIRMHVRSLHCASQCTDGTKLMGRTQSQTGRKLDFADRRVDLIGENVDCVVRGGNADELSLIAHPLGRAS
ncbi:hypothetical protein [Paraburkholderia terrae]